MTVLDLATLGDAKKVEMILSLLHRPRWPRQVQPHAAGSSIVALESANVNSALCKNSQDFSQKVDFTLATFVGNNASDSDT